MRERRFWLIYAVAWLPYALSYYFLFRRLSVVNSPLTQVAYNILPAALLGVLVFPWTKLVCWRMHQRWWFYPTQITAAVCYSVLWYFGVLLAGSIGQWLTDGRWHLGYFSLYAAQWQFFSGLMIYGNIAGLLYVAQVNETLRAEERRRERAESLQHAAELSALRAQLNPHFLFNTLNSIMALTGPEQPNATQAIAQLAAMLRYTLGRTAEESEVSLRQELAFTELYLELEMLRLGNRLAVVREIDPSTLNCVVPPLILQPLVENAIRHGIAPRASRTTLCIRSRLQQAGLELIVEDSGVGADADAMRTASGLGLRTVRQRLAVFGGGNSRIEIASSPGAGCKITLLIAQDAEACLAERMDAQELSR